MDISSRTYAVLSVLGVGFGSVFLWYFSDFFPEWLLQVSVIGLGYAFLLGTSGFLVDEVLAWANAEANGEGGEQSSDGQGGEGGTEPSSDGEGEQAEDSDEDEVTELDRDVGIIVGKTENILLLTFILAEAYTALSIIFAAKGLVRREDIRKNTRYYLAGTMANVTYSVVVGVLLRVVLEAAGLWPVPL